MKIALIISGQLGKFNFRKFEEHHNCHKSISDKWKTQVNKYDIDVFAITEDNNYYNIEDDAQIFSDNKMTVTNNNSWRLYKNKKIKTYSESFEYIENILKNCFGDKIKKYEILDNLKNFNIDNYKTNLIKNKNHKIFYDYALKVGTEESQIFGLLSQFYKIQKCFNFMEEYENKHNFKYDIVIRCRFDAIWENNDFQLDKIDYSNTVHSPKCPSHMNDWFCIGNRFIMEKYCNYYSNFVPNLLDNYYCYIYHENGKIIEFEKGYNIKKKNKPCWDVSQSSEIGLNYIIENKNNFNIKNLTIILDKFWS